MWAADAPEEDDQWRFTEDGDGFSYVRDAPSFHQKPAFTGSLEKKSTGEKFKVTLRFAQQYLNPGETQLMSGGERGCAHSHRRLWEFASKRAEPTLVLEDDVHLGFDRNGDKGKMNGKVFTKRLAEAIARDVIYLGWSGWRGGNFKLWKEDDSGLSNADRTFIQKASAEYVWTTVAYVISQARGLSGLGVGRTAPFMAGAQKLLQLATPIDQPVDNFMAWQASQGNLKSFVALDEGDEDSTWAGGIVDQFDFQGDSDIKKSGDLESTRFLASLRKLCVTLPTRPPVELVRVGRTEATKETMPKTSPPEGGLDSRSEGRRACGDAAEAKEASVVWGVAVAPMGGCLHYEDRREAEQEITLEGGEGDAVYFQRVRPGSRAEQAGVQAGDEVLQVNLLEPSVLFWRPGEEILPSLRGPVMLQWRARPAKKWSERTRINHKPLKLQWHADEHELVEVVPEYPKSRARSSGAGEWICGSCDANNFDTQEHCRRCGLRDSRLPPRPGKAPQLAPELKCTKSEEEEMRPRAHVAFGPMEIFRE
ncbi:unnamed protein product, partial [Durusdinium trenchii]